MAKKPTPKTKTINLKQFVSGYQYVSITVAEDTDVKALVKRMNTGDVDLDDVGYKELSFEADDGGELQIIDGQGIDTSTEQQDDE